MISLAIDRGHGGKNPSTGIVDPGAVAGGLVEADITGLLGDGIVTRLQHYDVTVLDVPRLYSLTARAEYANQRGADFYLSIHSNAGGGTGFESYIHLRASAEAVRLQKLIHGMVYGDFFSGKGIRDRGMKRANFIVLRETQMPALLMENLFVDHAKDVILLKDTAFIDQLANEIAWALVTTFSLRKKPDPCENCEKLAELQADRNKLFTLTSEYRQVVNQACGILAVMRGR